MSKATVLTDEHKALVADAAAAIGIKGRWWSIKNYKTGRLNGMSYKTAAPPTEVFGTHHKKPWMPLDDSGEALRLALKLRMDVNFDELVVQAVFSGIEVREVIITPEDEIEAALFRDEVEAAIRLAIVVVAARIRRELMGEDDV